MPSASDKTTTFGIRVPTETNAAETANSVEELRKRILSSQDAVKGFSNSMRMLKGSSDEVKGAKEKLKAAIKAEESAISQNTLAMGAMGTTFLDAAKQAKENAAALDTVKASSMGVLGVFGALGAALIAVSAGFAGATISLVKFALEEGNILRTQGLFREAATGSEENARNFGHQIDALASKIPTTREELNNLSLSLSKSLIQARISGPGIVDVFNAVAQESAAMGDSAGKAIEDILTRGKMMGRLSLGVNELQGTGIQFTDVAGALAKNLKISMAEAQGQLMLGRTNLDTGAKAVREVIEKRFGAINARRMLDLNVQSKKLKDNLQSLTEDINIVPFLEGFAKLVGFFDKSNVSGDVLHGLLKNITEALAKAFKYSLPFIEKFFNQILIESLKLEILLLDVGLYLKKTFGVDFKNMLGDGETGIMLIKGAFMLLGAAIIGTAAAVGLVGFAIYGAIEAVKEFAKPFVDFYKLVNDIGWAKLGSNIIDGITAGFQAGVANMANAVGTVADSIKEKFKNALGIHSPSAVFAEYGKQTAQGYQMGVENGANGASGAVYSMVGAGGGGGGSGAGPVSLTINLSLPNAKNGEEVKQALQAPSFMAQWTRALEEVLKQAGGAPQSPIAGTL